MARQVLTLVVLDDTPIAVGSEVRIDGQSFEVVSQTGPKLTLCYPPTLGAQLRWLGWRVQTLVENVMASLLNLIDRGET